eukprot:68055-Chlamydomonas_euryale.AAC.1
MGAWIGTPVGHAPPSLQLHRKPQVTIAAGAMAAANHRARACCIRQLPPSTPAGALLHCLKPTPHLWGNRLARLCLAVHMPERKSSWLPRILLGFPC